MARGHDTKPHTIDATILFIDLMNSVALSNTLTLLEYNSLINDYQNVLCGVIDEIRQSYPVGERYLGGDQLAVFFYDPEDAVLHEKATRLRRRHPHSRKADEMEEKLEFKKSRCLYGALRCAVQVKNAWTAHPRNISRVHAQQPVLDVGVGVNTGHVILQRRREEQARIEGFAINFAKRVEGYSRNGRFCKVMLSKTAYETWRNTVVGHVMLKQRAFFAPYTPEAGMLKGLAPGTRIYELKFFHRLAGFSIPPDQVELYRQIFLAEPTNYWAYSNLMNYHLYEQEDIRTSFQLAHRALYSNPENEKIYYDLAYTNLKLKEYEAAREYCLHSLELNHEMDIAYDMLAEIEIEQGGSWEQVLTYRAKALSLSPGCAEYQLDMALALSKLRHFREAKRHLKRALKISPALRQKRPGVVEELEKLLSA
jgi:class 3 adenylate cyclase